MSTPDSELDKHLRALFGGLDTSAGFDARLMARLRAESQTDAIDAARRARQQEHARYRRAVLELQSGRRSTLRLLTLDTLAIALLLVVAGVTAWPHLSRDVMDISHRYGPYIVMLLGVLIAAVPLLGMWAEQTRRPIRLL
jgi:hypothetical protein